MGIRLHTEYGKVNITAFLEYLLMALVVLYSSMWCLFVESQSNFFLRLAYPVLLVLIVLKVRVVSYGRLQRLILLAAALAVYLLGTRYNVARYGLYFVGPLLLLMLYIGMKDNEGDPFGLLYKLGDIVTVLTVISLVCFVFGTCLDVLPFKDTVSYYFAGYDRTCTTYFHLYYAAQTMLMFGHELVRNCGMFAEAPGFAMFLVIALATEVFFRVRPRLWRCGVIAAAALTTFSTKAILLVMLVVGIKVVIDRPRRIEWQRLKVLVLPLGGLVLLGAAAVLLIDKMNTASFFIRLDDLAASFKAFASSPLFGTGYYNDDSIIALFAYDRSNNGLSMGLAVLLAQGGLFLTAVYLVPMYLCIRRFCSGDRLRVAACFLVYIWLLFVSNMPFSFLSLFLLAFSMEAGQSELSHHIT